MFVLSFDIPVDNFEVRRCQLSGRVRDRVGSPEFLADELHGVSAGLEFDARVLDFVGVNRFQGFNGCDWCAWVIAATVCHEY